MDLLLQLKNKYTDSELLLFLLKLTVKPLLSCRTCFENLEESWRLLLSISVSSLHKMLQPMLCYCYVSADLRETVIHVHAWGDKLK